jgi:Skp family chaperone for outer membrane proteins
MEFKTTVILTLCALVLFAAGEARAEEPASPAVPKIGFVNLKKIFDEYERSATFEKEINDFKNAEAEKLEKTKKKVEELQKELDLIRKNSKEWFKIQMDIVRKKKELETDEKLSSLEIKRRLLKASEEIYQDIIDQIKEYAEAKGYALILKIESGRIESDSEVQFMLKVNSRGVLFYKEDLDITDEIVRELNIDYSGKKPDDGEGEGEKETGEGEGEKTPGEGEKKAGEGEEKAGGTEEKPGGEEKKTGEGEKKD